MPASFVHKLLDVDLMCIRSAACEPGSGPGRFSEVKAEIVKKLVAAMPGRA